MMIHQASDLSDRPRPRLPTKLRRFLSFPDSQSSTFDSKVTTMWKSQSILLILVVSTGKLSQAFLAPASASSPLFGSRLHSTTGTKDTPETLPEFNTAQSYLEYMESVSALPKGFATGTADGTFVSAEAPSLGNLKIRGTVIHVTSGPTDNWAACFTSNKVRSFGIRKLLSAE